jgi:acyl-CoA synthetase (AMP-forming)/AMP-acid ligase II
MPACGPSGRIAGAAAAPGRWRRTKGQEATVTELLHELIMSSAGREPDRTALTDGARAAGYGELADRLAAFAAGLQGRGVARFERVAVFLPKNIENVVAMFGTAQAGGIFVPVNPLLKPAQVAHILTDSEAAVLVTTADRLQGLGSVLAACPSVRIIVTTDAAPPAAFPGVDAGHDR